MADYTNPGAAATGALFDFLAEREAKKRQAMLDEAALAQQQWDNRFKTDQHAQTVRFNDANIANANAQTESLRAQRDAAIAEKDQKRALGVISMMQPGAAVDADTAGLVRQGGFGSLLRAPGVVAGMPREADAAIADEVDSALLASDPNALRTEDTFRGTPQQLATQRFLADPNVPQAVRDYMQARTVAGDENIPYQLFQDQIQQTRDPMVRAVGEDLYERDPASGNWRKVVTGPVKADKDAQTVSLDTINQTTDIRNAADQLLAFVESNPEGVGPQADYRVRLQQSAATGDISATAVNLGMRLFGANAEQALNVAAQLDTVRALIIQRRMDLMRMRSAVGATGLGQLSEREAEWLAASEGALSQAQSKEQFQAGLRRIIERMNQWEQRADVQAAMLEHRAAGRMPGGVPAPPPPQAGPAAPAPAPASVRRYNPATGRIE